MELPAERAHAVPRHTMPIDTAVVRAVTGWPGTVLLALGAGGLIAFRLDVPAFFDNEGRYAEVAREMLLRGDWISPHLDFSLFLNKPPLAFWLTAVVFQVGGPTEWARLVSVGAAVVALIATGRLGALLYGEDAGLVACLALATTLGFVLEARTLRPDMILVAAVVVALLCWQRSREPGPRRTAWLVALYAALGVGVLAKGLVVPVVAGVPVVLLTLQEGGWRRLASLRPGLGCCVLGALALPWHVAVARAHPGFAWDYVVNQHLLFFFDAKLPRDSEGDSLLFFWAAYAARAIPWVVLAPFTLREAMRGRTAGSSVPARATFFLWTWLGTVLLLFSCTPSRLEHYALPALPPAALLAARTWQRLRAGDGGRAAWRAAATIAGAFLAVGVVGVLAGQRLLAGIYWVDQIPALARLAVPAGAAFVGGGLLLAVASVRRHAGIVLLSLIAVALPLSAVVVRAEVAVEPLFSWRPLADALGAGVPRETEIVFEAPEEYQLVGGLAYYTRRRITLLAPPHFVPPTYLAGQTATMFTPQAEFVRRWQSPAPVAFVSDPQRRRESPAGLVPDPFRVLGRFGDRWVLANPAASPAS